MKKIYLFLLFPFLLTLIFSNHLSAQVFVKSDASGAGDGSSWADAYTDLQTALDAIPYDSTLSNVPDIWIATGTYTSTKADLNDTEAFLIQKPVNLYGGFAGTESAVSDREIQNNPTILSGDPDGDDIPDDFDSNKSDNFTRVIYVDSTFTYPVRMDGLDITGGNGSNNSDTTFVLRTGGGIFSWNPIMADNCNFYGNFSRRAGCVYLNGADGSSFNRCIFRNNGGGFRSAGIYAFASDDMTVTNCEFKDNEGTRGVLYFSQCMNPTVDLCSFSNNSGPGFFSGALYIWNSPGMIVSNCSFVQNTARIGGAVYSNGSDYENEPFNLVDFENCIFQGNSVITTTSSAGGGSVYLFNTKAGFSNCRFEGNSSDAFGGNVSVYSGSRATFNTCEFDANSAFSGGGSIAGAFGFGFEVDNCLFTDNEAGWGAAMFLQGEADTVVLRNSEFNDNTANRLGGGAVYALREMHLEAEDCQFISNQAIERGGGAIFATEDSIDYLQLDLDRCYFAFNEGLAQGGAIDVNNCDLYISNSIFFSNVAGNEDNPDGPTGRGGAIMNNASLYYTEDTLTLKRASDTSRVVLLNNSFVENEGDLSSGVAHWEYLDDTLKSTAMMSMQNNLFYYSDFVTAPHFGIEAGQPMVTSLGGNLAYNDDQDDTSLDTYFISTDISGQAPMLVDAIGEDFEPATGSPLINAGVAAGAPDLDWNGNQRDAMPDIGAIESSMVTSTDELEDLTGFTVQPNPAEDHTFIEIENDWHGKLSLDLTDASGKVVLHEQRFKAIQSMRFQVLLTGLPAGMYQIRLSNGDQRLVQSLLVK